LRKQKLKFPLKTGYNPALVYFFLSKLSCTLIIVAVPPGMGVGFTTGAWILTTGAFSGWIGLLFGIFYPLLKCCDTYMMKKTILRIPKNIEVVKNILHFWTSLTNFFSNFSRSSIVIINALFILPKNLASLICHFNTPFVSYSINIKE
jgi:hypothetical protein